ncbi:2233_t:CDS:1, partial [Dentiscutata erythropus]
MTLSDKFFKRCENCKKAHVGHKHKDAHQCNFCDQVRLSGYEVIKKNVR